MIRRALGWILLSATIGTVLGSYAYLHGIEVFLGPTVLIALVCLSIWLIDPK